MSTNSGYQTIPDILRVHMSENENSDQNRSFKSGELTIDHIWTNEAKVL